jgi:monoamine oxidase
MSPYTKSSQTVQSFNPHNVWHSGPIFAQAASTNGAVRLVATAGQVGVDANGVIIKDPEAQIEQAFKNLRNCLEAAGATVKDVYKLVWYIVNYDPQNRLYRKSLIKFLDGHRPATTAMGVAALAEPDYVFEIEAYAAVKQFPLQKADVVVVGAGLSGLKAAYDVQQAGHTCLVVEARDRVGGKTWSVDPLGQDKFVDLGAAWINDTNQSHIYDLVKMLGLYTASQNVAGNVVQEDITGEVSTYPYGSTPKVNRENLFFC